MKTSQKVPPIIAAIAIQLCLGIPYIWSVFQTGIANSIFGGDNALAGMTYSLLLATLSVGSMIGGKLSGRFSTRTIVIFGGVIVSLGFLLASTVTSQNAWLLWVGYGLMGGVGMGCAYSTTIACAQKWFPEKKGLITGLIVAALGMGGVVFTPIVESLISGFGGSGVGETKTFLVLSGVFLTVCTVGALFLKNPPEAAAKAGPTTKSNDRSPGQVLRDPRFYLISFSMMLACIGGLMMIGFAKPIATVKGLGETATIGVLVITMCNALGRLFWGAVSDKLGRKKTILVLLVGSAVLSALVSAAEGYVIYVLIGLIGFCYGGFLSNFPSLTADLFGAKHMATNYGMVMVGFGFGAIASSYIAGYFKNIAGTDFSLMSPAFFIAAGCAAMGIALMLCLKTGEKKKES